jgi:hypothetical protein
MRSAAFLLALLLLAPGCFVFDELEAGRKIMEQHSPKTAEQREAASKKVASSTGGKQDEEGMLERVQGWLAQRKADAERAKPTVHSEDVPVRCEIRGRMQFLRKFDCQLRGGREV